MSRQPCPACRGGWIKLPHVPVQRLCDVCHGRTTVTKRFLRRFELQLAQGCWECGLLRATSGNTQTHCPKHVSSPTAEPSSSESVNDPQANRVL